MKLEKINGNYELTENKEFTHKKEMLCAIGKESIVIGGEQARIKGGVGSILRWIIWDGIRKVFRHAIRIVGKDGILPDVEYIGQLLNSGIYIRKNKQGVS